MIWHLLALALLPQASATSEAEAVSRSVQRAVEERSLPSLERTWRAALARNPGDRRALLWMATIDRWAFRYERSDTLYLEVVTRGPAVADAYTAAAHAGMASWRALGAEGRRADSLFSLALAEARAVGSARTAFESAMGLSQLRGRTAGPRAGVQLVREAWARLERPSREDSAQVYCIEGALLEQLGDTTGTDKIVKGVHIATQARAPRLEGSCKLLYAQAEERRGYKDATTGMARAALAAFERANYLVGTALASQWLGYAQTVRNDFEHGRPDLERAVAAARATRFESVEAWAHGGLAEGFLANGELRAAREHAVRAAELHAAHGDLWGLAVARRFEGIIYETQNRLPEARDKYREAIAVYQRGGMAFYSVDLLKRLALVDMRLGALDSAQRSIEQGTTLARASKNDGYLSELPLLQSRLAVLRGNLSAADSLLHSVPSFFDWRRARESYTYNVQYALLEADLALRTRHVAVAESAVTYVSSTIAEWRRRGVGGQFRAAQAQLRTGWESMSIIYPSLVAGFVAAGRIPTAFRFIESVRARELTEASLRSINQIRDTAAVRRELRRLEPSTVIASITNVQRWLSRDEAFVSLALGVDREPSTAIIVTTDTTMVATLPGGAVLRPLIERYARVAVTGTEPVAIARQLGAAFLDPIARLLPPHVSRLLLSPDGELYHVPFDALRLADDRYAAERFAISLMPSATYAVVVRSAPQQPAGAVLVTIANPDFVRPAESPSGERAALVRSADTARFSGIQLRPLPHSAEEARRVTQYAVNGRSYVRREASEAMVRKADWRGVGVVHFATHALVDGEGQSLTALALSPSIGQDGFLTPANITSLRFDRSLIVLSACETLGGQILGGEGLRGLVAPLLEAGARTVVATQWAIGDRSVTPFIDRFYAAMAAGENVGDALRTAKLAAIRDGARISDWAAFTVIGDASMHPTLRPRKLSPIGWLRDLAQPMRDTTGT